MNHFISLRLKKANASALEGTEVQDIILSKMKLTLETEYKSIVL